MGGAKNASFKLMIATLLGSAPSTIHNVPAISDVAMVAKIIGELGGTAVLSAPETYVIDPRGLEQFAIASQYGSLSRASTLFLPALLARFGEARVPLPGGDRIGRRPLDRHMEGLQKMGVRFYEEKDVLVAQTEGLRGTRYRFAKNTHTGTETMIMAGAVAEGKTILENAAQEPEIDDLIAFLTGMGARIRRTFPRTIEIEGTSLGGTTHSVMPDRNEAVSFACAALASQGDVLVEGTRAQDLTAFLEKLTEIGAGYEVRENGIRFFYTKPLQATEVTTGIHPGFMTDWQPLWAALMCHAHGTSTIHETVMQNRFQYVDVLRAMGAEIETFVPETAGNPEEFYNFNWQDAEATDVRAIRITGPTQFHGGEFTAHDLRAGAIILIAALSTPEETTVHRAEQIERGYAHIDQKLSSLGATIEKIEGSFPTGG